MFGPGRHSEHEVLVGYLDTQLAAIRTSAFGLTEAQARETPCRSALSIGGLVKHATYVMEQRVNRYEPGFDPTAMPDEAGFAVFLGSFALTEDETLDGALAQFDDARERYLAGVRACDPGADDVEPPAPWDGRMTGTDSVQRFYLVHHVEELARHAGHADIIREQLDGADAASLTAAVEGRPANDFVQPWQPPRA